MRKSLKTDRPIGGEGSTLERSRSSAVRIPPPNPTQKTLLLAHETARRARFPGSTFQNLCAVCRFERANTSTIRTPFRDESAGGWIESRQNAPAQQVSNFGAILTGLADVVDPRAGTKFQVFIGPNANYYINGSGVKINSNLSPGPGST